MVWCKGWGKGYPCDFQPLVRSSSLFHKNSPPSSLQVGCFDRDFRGFCSFLAQERENRLKSANGPLKTRERGPAIA